MPLIIKTNMFYLLKNFLLLILVIFKLKCNNLILNEIRVLNASYVCLHAFSLRQELPDLDPERRTLISEVVLSHEAHIPDRLYLIVSYMSFYMF
jgi:hypothetical protein